MASEKPETDGFLAMIEAKIAALQALADSYRTALSMGALGAPTDDGGFVPPVPSGTVAAARSTTSAPVELPTGAFRNQGMASAIRIYLAAAKRKQTLKQIATALLDGGLASTSSNFEKTLNTTLHRLKDAGELLQFKDGWDLASSYPESLRQRLTKDTAPKVKPKPKLVIKTRIRKFKLKAGDATPESEAKAQGGD